MSVASILLHLDPAYDNKVESAFAIDLAKRFDAHLVGLTAVSTPQLPIYGLSALTGTVVAALEEHTTHETARVRKDFEAEMQREGLPVDFRGEDVLAVDVADTVALHGRHADMIVMRQSSEDHHRLGGMEVVDDVVLAAGRPVLVVPYIGASENAGSHIVVGWDATREAARALGDAMPLLSKADKVSVLVVNPAKRGSAHGEMPGADVSAFLARHGLNVELVVEPDAGIDAANMILSRAADIGGDMLVMGAFAHSRIRQTFFGGVTSSILRQMTMPVLLSH